MCSDVPTHQVILAFKIQFALFIRILRTLLLIQIPALYYPQQNKARRTKARFYTEIISCSNSTTDVRSQVIFQKNLDTQLKIARVIVEKLSVTCHLLIEEIPLVGSGFLSLNNATFVVESFITVDIPFRAPITMRY